MTPYETAQQELHTLRDFLRWLTSRFNGEALFFGHGNEDAFNEASQLLLHALNLPVSELPEAFLDARLTTPEKLRLLDLARLRIEQRVPLPYLTHEAWFAGLSFYVDERVLIPRSPFAELITSQFQPWIADPEAPLHILDMCTGSGCIAIACADAFDQAEVDAVDLSTEALAVAAINIERHGLEDRVHPIQSDLWQQLEPAAQYDLIVCNPPYVGAEEMAGLPAEYRHEPASALAADDNGLALVEQILAHAADYLAEDGFLFVEVGNSDEAVEARWPDVPFLWLEFAQGGHGVFMLNREQCVDFARNRK